MSPAGPLPLHLTSNRLTLLLLAFLLLLLLSALLPTRRPQPPPQPSPSPLPLSSIGGPLPPSIAYLLTGSAGDSARLLRLLQATYHPRNAYLLSLDASAPAEERTSLARTVRAEPAFEPNVYVVGKPGFANPSGPTKLGAVLHGMALLLRVHPNWDWIVFLHADSYPLLSQDDILHVFSFLPKELNFVQYTSYIGWKESRRLRPVIVDPGLFLSSRSDMFYATQKREMPNAYRLFTGSPSVILSRKFSEHCILGTDNLPRTLLMYYTNVLSPDANYFQTLLCNTPEFNRTVVNHNLFYSSWDRPSAKEPRFLTPDDFGNVSASAAAFAIRFAEDAPILDRIDEEILGRKAEQIVPGGWCIGSRRGDPCSVPGNPDILRPSPRATNLAKFLANILSDKRFYSNQCTWDHSA